MTTKHAGIDIGKRNLSLCIMTKDNDKKIISIDEWIKIDLMDEDTYTCDGILKNKQKCNAEPKFYGIIDNIKKHYCGIHKKQYLGVIDKNAIMIKYDGDKISCIYKNNKNNQCNKNSCFMINNTYYCKLHADMVTNQIIKTNSLKPYKKLLCSDIDPQILCARMIENFNKYETLKLVNKVKIEKQPPMATDDMKSVASMVFAYFVGLKLRYNLDMNVVYSPSSTKIVYNDDIMTFVCKKLDEHNKIKTSNCKCDECKLGVEINDNKIKHGILYKDYNFVYDSIKVLGKYYAEYITIQNGMHDKFLEIKQKYKKYDDECDAFLHAYKN